MSRTARHIEIVMLRATVHGFETKTVFFKRIDHNLALMRDA